MFKKFVLAFWVAGILIVGTAAPAYAIEWCLVHVSSSQIVKCFKYKKVCDQVAKGYNGEAVCVAQ